MNDHVFVGDVAKLTGLPVRAITGAIYDGCGELNRVCPLIGGRRAIPRDQIARVVEIVTKRGTKRSEAACG
jgi:hypothetical protein